MLQDDNDYKYQIIPHNYRLMNINIISIQLNWNIYIENSIGAEYTHKVGPPAVHILLSIIRLWDRDKKMSIFICKYRKMRVWPGTH